MNINLITRAKVKTFLGIGDTSYDAQIDVYIPIVSTDIRRILNNEFDLYVTASYTTASTDIILPDYRKYQDIHGYYYPQARYWVGQVLQGNGIPDDTYIQSYNPLTDIFTLSATTTDSDLYVYPTIRISQWPTISKMIFYKISKATTASATERTVSSKTYGPVSLTYSQSEINKEWDYPQVLLDDLGPVYQRVH